MNIDIKKLQISELTLLKSKVEKEIRIRLRDKNEYNKRIYEDRENLIMESKMLVKFIENEVGFKLTSTSRAVEVVTWRCIISKYLYDNGLSLVMVGRVLQRDHSTIIHSLNNYDIFKRHNDELLTSYIPLFNIFIEKYQHSKKKSEK